MAEMDIYMRRRLVALGGLVLFFIFFVLLVKSCGGDDEPTPVTPTGTDIGASGEAGAALAEEDYILQADQICSQANDAVGSLDPTDPGAIQDEFQITSEELASLESLQLAEPNPNIDGFLADLSAVVAALRAKDRAGEDIAAQDAAQLEIDTAEVDARASGERAGFNDCGQFLDAGDGPGAGGDATDTGTDTGTGAAVPPTDTGTVTPPPTDTGTVTPPPTDPSTPITPPDDGGGGITP